MNLSSDDAFDDENAMGSFVLIAKSTDMRLFHQMLKAVNFKDYAMVIACVSGFKVIVEETKCVQCCAFIGSNIFDEYRIDENHDSVSFKICLTYLLDCLNIFGSSNSPGIFKQLEMRYAGYGSPLTLLLKEEGVVTTCSIGTHELDSILDFNFSDSDVVSKIIMKSSFLKDCFAGADSSSSILEIHVSPDKPFLRISTYGNAMTFQTECSRDSELVDVFQVSRTQTNRYKMSLIKTCVKALIVSSSVSLRMDGRGFLFLQFMIQLDEHFSFVDYYCTPDEDDEEQ